MAQRGSLRASDSDREQIAERLRCAAAEGRLLATELEQRLATALRARTYGELDELVSDLPGERLSRRRQAKPLQALRSLPTPALVIAIPVAFALVIAAVAVMIALFTTWITLAVLAWLLFGHRYRRYYGPRLARAGRPIGVCHARAGRLAQGERRAMGGFTPWL